MEIIKIYSLSLIWFIGGCGPAWGKLNVWRVGKGGVPWQQVGSFIGVETVDGSIQPMEFHPYKNIMQEIKWHDAKPKDFVEEGDGYVWDNAAWHESDLVLVDGDSTTSTGDRFKAHGVSQVGLTFFFDLGAPRFASRLVFYPRQSGSDESGHPYREDFIRGFQIFVSDGKSFSNGYPIYSLLRENPWNSESIVDIRFPLQPIRFIKLRVISERPFEIAEVELYGEGFMKESKYVSKIVELGGLANFGKLKWGVTKWRKVGKEVQADPDAQVSIMVETRCGQDDTPLIYHKKTQEGEVEVSKEVYDKLPSSQKGSIVYDIENWSQWSQPYLTSGKQIVFSKPCRYFQFRITLKSGSIWEFAKVESLVFEYSTPPLAKEVRGEIALLDDPSPITGVATVVVGKSYTFSYDIKADIEPSQYGFDVLKIKTPSEPRFRRLEMGEPLTPIPPDSVDVGPDFLKVFFPSHKITYENNQPLRVVFDTEVLLYGTIFAGEVSALHGEELPQPIVEGNANEEVTTNSLRVAAAERSLGDILSSMKVSPNPVTPNGDGRNDKLTISYTIAQLRKPRPLDIRIYDMSGRLVKAMPSDYVRMGKYRKEWDCRDESGLLVPPGIYICKLSIHTDKGTLEKSKAVAIVY